MDDPFLRPAMVPAVIYKDPWAALDWLEEAFGFERSMVISAENGNLSHAEMRFGGGLIYVGSKWANHTASPTSAGAKNTQSVHILLKDGLDAHCARARAAGAAILREPGDQFYGDRTYSAMDPEGHVWTFGQSVRHVSREEAEQVTGLKIEGWH
ncbi:MAG: VOC family protein [Beijerinckiaceae bacterium]|nr:VOC family protein [Beijerinckiaceae bacterium]MCI0735426.1 VOC family protein [Beijerinckiaceae bacterium]